LPQRDSNNQPDTICKCTLLPDKITHSTKLVRRSSNPIFEEQFEFNYLDSTHLENRSIEITIYELDKANKEEICIGTALVRLNNLNLENKVIILKELRLPIKSNEVNNLNILFEHS
jgi:Ca2+-dependent lipid-binding protein